MMNQYVAYKLRAIFLDADLVYHLKGTPHSEYLETQAKRELGQTRRILMQVAALGPEAKVWMDNFIEELCKNDQ